MILTEEQICIMSHEELVHALIGKAMDSMEWNCRKEVHLLKMELLKRLRVLS